MAKIKAKTDAAEPTQLMSTAVIGPLQLRVMRILWTQADSQGTVADVHTKLNDGAEHPLAYTTVLTVMRNLARRQVVTQIPGGRQHIFRANLTAAEYETRIVRSMLSEVFGNDRRRMAQVIVDA
jgi:predicted transcriptional regulator